ncbi:lysosomal alpha-mannosidase-like [Dendronephthya gigantea]|uniref:lysosomal alpha-mannosidase-like n=1 Tax=Dendronephthya gigantea TaxID=151771 RepID=UPI00106A0F77|nr:lysosomal alpha-mannosidase-like [Dendronephthya gigantea]
MALLYLFLCGFSVLSNALVVPKSPRNQNEIQQLQIHLVSHTHDDVGWLKTVDEYYYGANNSIQIAGVQYILDSVIPALEANPLRRFIYVEMAFFKRWWVQQTPAMQERVKALVNNGQLEFINGGWCMNDEATTHYNAIIDQMTHGLQFIDRNFGSKARPRVAWHIDPFGHSAEQASLFAQMSFEGFFFARIHYADIKKRREEQLMEFKWRGSQSLGKASEIFTGVLYNGYGPPSSFCFDILCGDPPMQDDPRLFDFNVKERVDLFIKLALEQASHYKSGHIMLTMGSDFNYQNAHTWFKNLDKLIAFVNEDGRVNAFYSTPSEYLDAIKGMDVELRTEDFFPYADCPHCYWTGYFTSRPALKGYVRRNNNLLQVCKQLEVLGKLGESDPSSEMLRDAMGVAQHHDAVSGTEKQHVAYDYAKRLAMGAQQCKMAINSALNQVIQPAHLTDVQYTFCDYLNISVCPATEATKPFTITVYNPIARAVDTNIRIPVSSKAVKIFGPDGKEVSSVVQAVSKETEFVRGSLGNAPYELTFTATGLPPLGVATYTGNTTSNTRRHTSTLAPEVPKETGFANSEKSNEDYVIANKHLRLTFSNDSGRLTKVENLESKISLPVDQQFLWYNASSVGNKDSTQASGAYIFRPNSSTPLNVSTNNKVSSISVIQNEVFQEIHQVFSPWVSQTVRLYSNKPYAEFEYTVGPIKMAPSPDLGKEIISRFDTSLKTNGVFYTDANGREMQLRKRNYRPTWMYNNTEPVAGNYYPINSRAYIKDESGIQLTVMTDRSLGGSSIKDGSLEFMVHRRLLHDDKRGVSEALNEPGINGRGLIVRGKFLLLLEAAKSSAKFHRVIGEEEMLRPSLAFSAGSGYQAGYQALSRSLPPNVHLLTLEKFDKSLLLRLEHQFAVGEDDELSKAVTVQLRGLFKNFTIQAITELNLSANQVKNQRERVKRGNKNSFPNDDDLEITLNPMEIRTYKLDIEYKS